LVGLLSLLAEARHLKFEAIEPAQKVESGDHDKG